jgi:hypothetical protein
MIKSKQTADQQPWQMAILVAGYYMSFVTTHAIMNKLNADEQGVDDLRLEFPI